MSWIDRSMSFIARVTRDHALTVVIVCVVLTVPVAVGATFLKVKAGQRDLIPTKFEAARTLDEVNRLFGGTTNEYPMVESDALLTYPMIKKFVLLEEEMNKAGIEQGEDYVYMEHYLTAFARNFLREAEKQYGAIVRDLGTILGLVEGQKIPNPDNPAEMVPFEDFVEEQVSGYLANPVAYKWTVEKKGQAMLSSDKRYAKILIKVNPELDSAQRAALATRVEDFFRAYFEEGETPAKVYITGDTSIDRDLEDYVLSSTWLLAVVAVALLMALLFLTFQRLTDVLLPLAVITLTTIWIYGLMGWAGLPFTMLSAIIGPLVLGISMGNLVYMMSRFYEEFSIDRDPRRSAYKSIVTVGIAVFLACITTVFGFASFGFSDFDALQDFGYMAAAGIGLCFFFSVTFLPALIIVREDRRARRGISRQPRGVKIFSPAGDSRVDRFLGGIAGISQGRPGAVVVVYGFIVLICIMGAFRLTTTPDLRALAPQDIPSLQAQYLEEGIFGGIQQDVVLIQGKAPGDILEPEVLQALRVFQERLAETPYFVENGSSSVGELIADYRSQMGKVGADGEPTMPATREEAEADLAEIGLLFGPQEGKLVSGDPEKPGDYDYRRAALVPIFSEAASSNTEMIDKDRALQEIASDVFGPLGVDYRVGGITPLTADMLGNLVPTQVKTAILALCLSAFFLVLVFRSFKYGLATLSVLVAGITVELGFLALMGWTLDIMTVLVVSLIIGMGIDYGIHVTHRFLEEYKPGETGVAEALMICITRVGKPLLAGVLCTSGAFLVISLSKMAPIRRFGLITALSLMVSFFASVLVLPSIITLIARHSKRVEEPAAEEEAPALKPA